MTDEVSVERALGRVEGKIDMIISRLDDTLSNHEHRISSTEKKVWYGAGIAGALSIFVGKLAFLPH